MPVNSFSPGVYFFFVLRMFVIATALASSACADDWPQWRGPQRNGISQETGWQAKWASAPPKVWQASVGVGYSSESVAKGRLYTMGNSDETDFVYCLDANTGQEIWKHDYACSARDPNG